MVQYKLLPHILFNISSLFLSFINTRQPSTFLPFRSALSHPFWIYNRAYLIRLFSRIRSSAWILPILFPPFHDNTCSAGAWWLARNSWHTAQELSAIVSVQTAEFINDRYNNTSHRFLSQFLFPLHTSTYISPAGPLLVSFVRDKTLRTWSECWLRATCWAGASVPKPHFGCSVNNCCLTSLLFFTSIHHRSGLKR